MQKRKFGLSDVFVIIIILAIIFGIVYYFLSGNSVQEKITNNEFYGKKRIFTDVIALIVAFILTTVVTTLFWFIPLKLIKVFLSKFRSPAKTL